ncbi:MAG: hypothetical protein IPK16_06315 [Anaerolineales bacterium]|nr:hypothetical protein [Anaerolineales bacterium]
MAGGERLKRLVDLQAVESNPLSLHSNIQSSTVQVKIRDQASQRVVATVDRQWLARDVLTLEGARSILPGRTGRRFG